MVISVAPIIASFLDSKCVYGVIMQTEIENDASPDVIKIKKELSKEFFHPTYIFAIANFDDLASIKLVALNVEAHCQTFYPTVPTPPPNA